MIQVDCEKERESLQEFFSKTIVNNFDNRIIDIICEHICSEICEKDDNYITMKKMKYDISYSIIYKASSGLKQIEKIDINTVTRRLVIYQDDGNNIKMTCEQNELNQFHGIHDHYDSSGKLISSIQYKNGRRNGSSYYDIHGLEMFYIYEDGKLLSIIQNNHLRNV